MKQLTVIALIVVAMAIGACAQVAQLLGSTPGKQFCSWAPIAVVAIQSAAQEAAKDPAKQASASSMQQAAAYLGLVAAQCPVGVQPTPSVS